MSSSSVNPLSAGVQQLYNSGLLPTSLNNSVLNNAQAGQLSQLANSSVALQEVNSLFGLGSTSTDSATLSSAASNALLQEINPASTSSSSATDLLTQAVDNALTSSVNAAVQKFLLPASNTSGQINLLG